MRALFLVLLAFFPGCGGVCKKKIDPPRAGARGAALVVLRDAECRIAPLSGQDVARTLSAGSSVRTIWAAGGFFYVQADAGVPCWVDGADVAPPQTSGSRGLPMLLTPILVAAGEYVVKGAIEWLEGGASNPACGIVKVLREEGERALVETSDGTTGWIARAGLAALSTVAPPDSTGSVADLQEGGALPPPDAGSLTVELGVMRPDGRPVPPEEVLRLGEPYDLAVRCSRDCFVRITAEQPENDAVCQYHPNHFSGFERSLRLAGGRWARSELLPPGRHFQVSEPIGDFDVIRVEASTSSAYAYVNGGDKGEGCQATASFHDGALTGCSRGGGFTDAPACTEAGGRGLVLQPQAMAVAERRLKTAR